MYPLLNKNFVAIKEQPLYCTLVSNFAGRRFFLKMNESAAKILQLCNGLNSVEEIKTSLAMTYAEKADRVSALVDNFLDYAEKLQFVDMLNERQERKNLQQFGSCDYWTPDVLAIELTENCPLRCRHCYVNAGKGATLPLGSVSKILEEANTFCLEHIQLTGGEPLIHPNFFEILDMVCSMGVTTHIFTSGYIMNDVLVQRLKTYASKNIILQVSVDGLEEYHDSFRGVKGCFRRTIGFIKEMVNSGFKVIAGLCVATQTYDEIKELCQLLKRIGVASIRIGAISDRGRAENKLASNTDSMLNVKQIQAQLSSEEDTETFKVIFTEDSQRIKDSEYSHNCGMGQTVIKISPTGNVSPCLMSDIVIGNISDETISAIQRKYSRIFEEIRIPSHQFCSECENAVVCENCINEGTIHCKKAPSCKWYTSQSQFFNKISSR